MQSRPPRPRLNGFISPWEDVTTNGERLLRPSSPRVPPPCIFCHAPTHDYHHCGRFYLLLHGESHAEIRRHHSPRSSIIDVVDSLPMDLERPSSLPKFVSHHNWVEYLRTLADYHCNHSALHDGRDGTRYIAPPMNVAPNGLGLITLPISVGGISMVALVDTGSSLSFL